ncbi:MAG: class I SAM-dependent methyltransferase [Halofilum sp. (in: g-proteobacteria)]|nr:class I SAM-dependent methyltransferase [Halofilum sp. (in: g-proteobacteria)]
MSRKDHWEDVYASRAPQQVGWYEPRLQASLRWIRSLRLPADAPVIDVGGGASTLVDDLLGLGHEDITVLDISEEALWTARARLRGRAEAVTWIAADITEVELPPAHYALWHDRAVFHFLTGQEDRRRYLDNLLHALRPGGHVVMGTFAPDAPPRCSGLPVQRYDAERLDDTLGAQLELRDHFRELHLTPGGVEQMYLYCLFRRRP